MKRVSLLLVLLAATACGWDAKRAVVGGRDTLVVFEAASLAAPMRAALDTFVRRTAAVVAEEHGGSLELARRITELHRIPDVIALADHEVFPQMLVPAHASWYADFAHNRMVVAYTDRSKYANEITAANWYDIVQRPDVLLGRADPVVAPAGYRALLVYKLAERHYRKPALAAVLEAHTPPRLLRGTATDLAALLGTAELDYIIEYESLARAQRLRFITLPPEIDLSDPKFDTTYAAAMVRVANGRDSVTRRGAPIMYGLTVPRDAPHAAVGLRFAQFLLGPEGRAILRAGNVDAFDAPVLKGDSIPLALRALASPE
jgi:molybdate/tungstate transport system substrate-binding protein